MKKTNINKRLLIALILLTVFCGEGWGEEQRFVVSYFPSHTDEINSTSLLITGAWSDTTGITVPVYYYACPMSMSIFAELVQPSSIVRDEWYARDMLTGKKIVHKDGWYLIDFRNREARQAVYNSLRNIIYTKSPTGFFLDHGEFRIYENGFFVEGGTVQALVNPELIGTWREYFSEVINYIHWFRKKVIINADPEGYFQFRNQIDGVYLEEFVGNPANDYFVRLQERQQAAREQAVADRKIVLIDPDNRVIVK